MVAKVSPPATVCRVGPAATPPGRNPAGRSSCGGLGLESGSHRAWVTVASRLAARIDVVAPGWDVVLGLGLELELGSVPVPVD